jgi:putative ABC transport system permease protein
MNDLKLAARSLATRPGFFAVCVVTLALGVASVSAIFSVVNGTLLKPLPYPDAHEIIRINRMQGQWGGPVSPHLMDDWAAAAGDLWVASGAFTQTTINLTGDGDARRLAAYRVTPGFWDVMGLQPALGRYFGAPEETQRETVVVLSHALWTSRFAGNPDVIGTDIVLNGVAHRIVAVTPASYRYPGSAEVYLPTHIDYAVQERGSNFLFVLARMRPGAAVEQVDAVLATTNARLANEYPANHAGLSARVTALPDLLNSSVKQPLLILLGASALVLLIACANLANLLLARGSHRAHELAVRAALGARRGQLMRVSLAEALVIALAGGVLGIGLAAVAVPALLSLAPGIVPSHGVPGMDARAVAVSLTATVFTVLAFALWPAVRGASVSGAAAMRDDGRTSAGAGKARARSLLVAGEVALSLTLLVGAGLLIESLRQVQNIDGGVDPSGVLTAAILLDGVPPIPGEDRLTGYMRHVDSTKPVLDAVLERVGALPGVEHVGLSDALPLSGMDNASSDVTIVGREVPEGEPQPGANWRFVSPGLLDALGMRINRGRALVESDWRPGEFPAQVMVNETFARRYLDGLEPIGQQVTFFDGNSKTIVGVVNDTRLHGIDRDVIAEVYMPHGYAFQRQFYLAVKVSGDPAAYAAQLRAAVRDVNPNIPVFEVRTMEEMVGSTIEMRSFNMTLMSVFSGVAVLLAALGLYGVISYSVAQRRREIGIRLSLGAAPPRIRRLVLADGARLIGAGIVVGVAAAFGLARVIASQLYGVTPTDPFVFSAVVVVLAIVGLVAVIIPARAASRVAPMEALRYE